MEIYIPIPIGNTSSNGGISIAMLVYRRVIIFHQARFFVKSGDCPTYVATFWGPRSCEVAINKPGIWQSPLAEIAPETVSVKRPSLIISAHIISVGFSVGNFRWGLVLEILLQKFPTASLRLARLLANQAVDTLIENIPFLGGVKL